jgi:hypothetical protein
MAVVMRNLPLPMIASGAPLTLTTVPARPFAGPCLRSWQQVLAFMQPADQCRALSSRIMQRCAVAEALAVSWREVALARTKGRKPFTTNAKPPHAPNFNFNVSHEVRPGRGAHLSAHAMQIPNPCLHTALVSVPCSGRRQHPAN